jgi:uncharacterized protein YjbJ (UPF0337 family)
VINQSTKNEVEGTIHELKGKVKEKAGQVTNHPGLEAEGTVEKAGGKIQKQFGYFQKAVAKRWRSSGIVPAVMPKARHQAESVPSPEAWHPGGKKL